MVRIIKKSILLSMILLSFSSLNCQTFGLNDIPLFSSEVNYDINLMIDAQKDFPLNEYSVLYADQIVEAENDFLKECSKLESSPYVGVWKLTDQLGNLVGHHSFNFSDTIEISIKTALFLTIGAIDLSCMPETMIGFIFFPGG